MNTSETQLINSMLALAALSANISPEELKEYVNVLSPKEEPKELKNDDRGTDEYILSSAIELLRVYRDESLEKMAAFEKHPFLRKVTPAIGVLEDCMEYFSKKEE